MTEEGRSVTNRTAVPAILVVLAAAAVTAPLVIMGVSLSLPYLNLVAVLDFIVLVLTGLWAVHVFVRRENKLEALKETEQFQRLLVERVPEGVIVHQDRIVQWANEQAAKILGYQSATEITGLPLKQFYTEETNRLIEDRYPSFRETGEWREVFPMLRKDGSSIRCRQAVTLLEETGGEYPPVLLSFRDITEEEKIVSDIEHTSRMEALERMAGGAAHDFNNILGGIMGYVSLIEEHVAGDEVLRRYSSTVMNAARRGSELTDQLLVFSRGAKTPRSPASPAELAAKARESVSGRLRPEMVFKHSCQDQMPVVRCAQQEIINSLAALCMNAVEAMPEGGVLSLVCDSVAVSASEFGEYRDLGSGLYVRFTVSDTGEGIPEQHMERIFEPFFSTKERRVGTGMGLPLAYAVAREHGGTLKARSEVGRGSEFQLLLPAAKKTELEESISEHKPTRAAEANLVGLKVMVVEDDAVVMNFLEECLEGEGAVVAAASSEAEALGIVSEGFIPEVALVDVILPDGEGLTLGSRLKDRGVNVIGMSGRATPKDARPERTGEVDGFLRKPFDKNALLELIRSVISPESGTGQSPSAGPPGGNTE